MVSGGGGVNTVIVAKADAVGSPTEVAVTV
jgi:hypothetical protein